MLKRIKVRGKLLLLIVTPLIAVLVFAFSGVTDRRDQASFQEREVRIAELADAGSDLSLAIQVERLRTLQATRLNMNVSEALAPERAETNAQLDRWLLAVARARADLDDPELLTDIDFIVERLPANLTEDRNSDSEMAAVASFLQLASRSVDDTTACFWPRNTRRPRSKLSSRSSFSITPGSSSRRCFSVKLRPDFFGASLTGASFGASGFFAAAGFAASGAASARWV